MIGDVIHFHRAHDPPRRPPHGGLYGTVDGDEVTIDAT
jgi:hypothetical protein